MQEHALHRAALLMLEKYDDHALPKCVAAAMYYAEKNDNKGANRWIKIGNKVKDIVRSKTDKTA